MKSATNQLYRVQILSVPKRQVGMVLVMALVMLTVLTLIGVTSMSTATLEMKVAGNMQQRNTAFQAAQSRLAFAGSQDPLRELVQRPLMGPPGLGFERLQDSQDSGSWGDSKYRRHLTHRQ